MRTSSSRHHLTPLAWALSLALGLCCFRPVALAEYANVAPDTEAPQNPQSPAIMLGKNWQAGLNPADFLVSEKLDGVRAVWDGRHLRFRSGRIIAAPAWFIAALPVGTALDGELWAGRRSFDQTSATTRRSVPLDAEWRKLRYMVFDLPGHPAAFEVRAQRIVDVVAALKQPWLQALAQTRVPDDAALQAQLRTTVSAGGEGLMLQRASALWTPGRSDELRKLKLTPDEDARVVAILPGKGRHAGRMGALLLQTDNGQRFALGTGFSDALRDHPPAVGTVVTYRYRDRTASGLPRFASFLRVKEPD